SSNPVDYVIDHGPGTWWQRLTQGQRWVQQRGDWPSMVGDDWPAWIMSVPVTDQFHAKQGRSSGRWVVPTHRQPFVVYLKRHYELPFWRGLLATLWPRNCWSPALQEWHHLEWAQKAGFPVPGRVAAGEIIGPWGRLQSFLAIEELTDMVPVNQAIPL